ncbi:MAG: hypothetical protein KDC35_02885 [Acidobacteria bacterium]|nr:hypothetical protein [Acidobacteriota bacterium]
MAAFFEFIAQHAWWIAFVGCVLEGELVLVICGMAIMRGLASPGPILLSGYLGAMSGDLLVFAFGHRASAQRVWHWRWLNQRRLDMKESILKRPRLTILIMRFQVGLRTISWLALAKNELDPRVFRGTLLWVNALWVGFVLGLTAITSPILEWMVALWAEVLKPFWG